MRQRGTARCTIHCDIMIGVTYFWQGKNILDYLRTMGFFAVFSSLQVLWSEIRKIPFRKGNFFLEIVILK
jgi:hypothetical protein